MTALTVSFRSGATGGATGVTQTDGDSATGWTGGALDTDSEVQGTGCIGAKVSNAQNLFINLGTSRDFVGGANDGDHVYTWLNCLTPNLDTIANGGLRVQIGQDSTTNFREFYVGGDGSLADDPYAGGWRCFVVDPTLSADGSRIFDTGTPDMNIADEFGGTVKTIAMISGNFNNGLIDAIRIGSGLRVINGTTPDPAATFADFVSDDEGTKNNRYGVIRDVGGVSLVQGKLFFGDGTTTTVFTDTNAVVVFEEANVAADFYEFYIATDATVTLGEISAGVTSGGCFIDSQSTDSAYTITVVEGGTTEAIFNAYATTFNEFRVMSLNPSTTAQDCTFSGGGQITLNGATLTACSILSSTVGADTGALLVDSQSEWDGGGTRVVTNCFFGGNNANANSGAIEISATGTFEFEGLTFSGNSFDVINSSGGAVTINVTNGDTPTVRNLTTSTTTVNVAAPIKVEGVTEGTSVILLANETVGTVTVGDVLTQQFADSNGEINYNLPYESAFDPSGLDILVKARNQGIAVAAIAEDGGVFTDETAEASSNSTADMTLLPTGGAAVNDAYYFAHNEEFPRLKLDISTAFAGTSLTITWEYWNGSAWTALSGVSDGTNGLLNTGPNIVSWTVPGNWATTSVNSQGPLYYVRYRVTAVSGQTTDPLGRKCALDVTRYLPYRRARTVTATGITDVASWQQDAVSQF
jgi:hypothetical protein